MIVVLGVLAVTAADPAVATQPKREVVLEFATCVERRAPDRARELLETEPGSDKEKQLVNRIAGAYGACIKNRPALSFNVTMLRGQLAEMAFRTNPELLGRATHRSAQVPIAPSVAAIDEKAAKMPADDRDAYVAETFRDQYARCVALSTPSMVVDLLPTAPASQAERVAILAAGDHLMACMPDGITYHLKPAELRPSIVSELYYAAVSVRGV